MYDIFISFKNLDKNGEPTHDSVLAREVFDRLSGGDFRVFFSPISLEKLGVSAYKAAIDAALDSSSILIAVGTSAENFNARWVRHEWDSFHNDILDGVKPEGKIFVYVDGCDPKLLPRTLRQSQVFFKNEGGLEKLNNFILNALPIVNGEDGAVVQNVNSAPCPTSLAPIDSGLNESGSYQFYYQSLLAKRYGDWAVSLAESYPFLKNICGKCDQERIYRYTGRQGPSGDREAACRMCGNLQEWDRYPCLELPKVCPNCGFDGDFSGRVFVTASCMDSPLVDIIVSELQLSQFRVKRSGLTRTVGGWIDLEQLKEELKLCKVCICCWTKQSENDKELESDLAVARELSLPILFLKTDDANPTPWSDIEKVVDIREPASWDAVLINRVSDCLAVEEKHRREQNG